jgi:putative peptidoglycan lipid II flippase
MSVQFFAIALIVAAGIIFSPYFMKIFFGRNDTPEIFNLSVNLIRLMFPYLFFVGFVAFAMGYLNSHRIFFAPAFSPVLLNVGIITGIVGLSKLFAESIYGVAIGVLLGGLLQFLLQLPYLKKVALSFIFLWISSIQE